MSHGLGDLVERFVIRDGDRWLLATYVFPVAARGGVRVQAIVDDVGPAARRLTGLPLVNHELAQRSCRSSSGGSRSAR